MAPLTIRRSRPADFDAYLAIQRASWGTMSVSEEQARSRFDTHPQGIIVAERDGEIVGAITLIRLAEYRSDAPLSWDEATGYGWCTTHVPDGPVVFGVDLSAKGTPQAVPLLIEAAVAFVSAVGAANLTWGGRLPGYAKYRAEHPGTSADEYLGLRTPMGRYLDWQVRMYSEVHPDVEVVRAVPDYFEDPESEDYGVLLRIPNPLASAAAR